MPKISALPPIATLATDDENPAKDTSAGATGKWTFATLKTWLQSLTNWVTAAMLDVGTTVQTVTATTSAAATGTTQIPSDDTIPQNTEGDQYMTVTITPKAAGNKLIVEGTVFVSHSVAAEQIVALFQDSTANAFAVSESYGSVATEMNTIPIRGEVIAANTSPTTFKVRAGGHAAGTMTFNGQGGGRKFGTTVKSTLKVLEIKA